MNISLAIKQSTKILKDKFIPNPELDSEILMAKTIQKDRKYILLNFNQSLSTKDLNKFNKLIEMRSLHNPVAHLTNKKFFWNAEFFVTKDTLIPRPDTELIIENVLSLTKQKSKKKILDIGIFRLHITICFKREENFYGTGVDISKNCLNITKINAINLKVNNRLKLYKSDVDKFNLGKYDLIVSNPPYIKQHKLKYLKKMLLILSQN